MNYQELKIGQKVYHSDVYFGKEPLEVVGIRKKEVELEGDYSGGTHKVTQKEWLPIDGIVEPDFIEVPKPVGSFIIENAEGIQMADGAYYHYAVVCRLLKLYKKNDGNYA